MCDEPRRTIPAPIAALSRADCRPGPCDALAHFLHAVPAREHPLLVALYLRSLARARRTETEQHQLALAMDQDSGMLVRDELSRDDER